MNRNRVLLIGIAITVLASIAVSTLLSTPVGSTPRPIDVTLTSITLPETENQQHIATPSSTDLAKQDAVVVDPALFSVRWLDESTVQVVIGVSGCVRNISYSQACLTADAGTYLIMPRPNQDWAYHPYRRNSTYGFWPKDGSGPYFIYVPYELPRFLPIVRNGS